MDYEKAKLRTDLDALAKLVRETTAALSTRVETLERQAAEEVAAKAAAQARVAAEAKAMEEARVAAAAAVATAKATKRLFGPKAKT